MNKIKTAGQGECKILEPPNPWARISEIAAKVGVGPIAFGHPATITARGADGLGYDVWEVVSAVLDRLDNQQEQEKS